MSNLCTVYTSDELTTALANSDLSTVFVDLYDKKAVTIVEGEVANPNLIVRWYTPNKCVLRADVELHMHQGLCHTDVEVSKPIYGYGLASITSHVTNTIIAHGAARVVAHAKSDVLTVPGSPTDVPIVYLFGEATHRGRADTSVFQGEYHFTLLPYATPTEHDDK